MRSRPGDLSDSFLTPDEPAAQWEHSALLIIAGRMQGESLRYQLVSCGLEVDLARSVSTGMDRVAAGSYDVLILDWQTLEVEYLGSSRADAWMRLMGEAKAARKPIGVVALLDSEQMVPREIEQAGVIWLSRASAAEPQV